MNRFSRTHDDVDRPGWNQSPRNPNADVATHHGIANSRQQHGQGLNHGDAEKDIVFGNDSLEVTPVNSISKGPVYGNREIAGDGNASQFDADPSRIRKAFIQAKTVLFRYAQFVGPGFLVSVAYIDPGNYQTDVNAGAATRFSHLFIVLMANLIAIFLQSLCIKLGSVTGLNLAENCKQHLPRWMNYILYFLAEAAIIATDMAEVIGSAIALNLLLKVPLVAGCAVTLVDVLVILIFYKPNGSMSRLRLFEFLVMALVLGVVVCFCIQLSYINNATVGEVFKGYLPSSAVIKGNGVYLSCGILGATVMPHSLFLGSGVVQSRLRKFDMDTGNVSQESLDLAEAKYRPTLSAIRSCLNYSIFELASSLFTFALFVNSAILIVAGSALYNNGGAADADLFSIHALLSSTLAPAAGIVFALALLLSGTSAGIVCTMAGQMVSEGMINWNTKPWLRRLITRSISIVPSVIISASIGKEGLDVALTASQVVLSVILPFVSAPIIYFTCRSKFMVVGEAGRPTNGSTDSLSLGENGAPVSNPNSNEETVCMKNSWPLTIVAVLIWLVLVVMNISLLVLVGLGKS